MRRSELLPGCDHFATSGHLTGCLQTVLLPFIVLPEICEEMPAAIVAVLDQPGVADEVVARLTTAGYDAAALPDPMAALNALEGAVRIEVLVTGLDHGPNKPNGISLALMARSKRPGIRVLFVGDGELAHYAAGLGEFLAEPVGVTDVVEHVIRLSDARQGPGN